MTCGGMGLGGVNHLPHAYRDTGDLQWHSMGYDSPGFSAFDVRWASAGFGGRASALHTCATQYARRSLPPHPFSPGKLRLGETFTREGANDVFHKQHAAQQGVVWSDDWPKAENRPMANSLNAATKYVATHRPDSPGWEPVEDLGPDISRAFAASSRRTGRT